MTAGGRAARVAIPVTVVTRWIWITVTVLIIATFVAQVVHELIGLNIGVILFDADLKLNFPTAAKVFLLIGSSVLLSAVAWSTDDPWYRVRWFGMSAVFALLTLDEMMYLHQRLSDGLHNAFETSGPLRFGWLLLYLPAAAVLLGVYYPFWRKLATTLRTRFLAAALCFAAGAGGATVIKGMIYDDDAQWELSFGLVAAVSDSLELIGLALMVTTLLGLLLRDNCTFAVSLRD